LKVGRTFALVKAQIVNADTIIFARPGGTVVKVGLAQVACPPGLAETREFVLVDFVDLTKTGIFTGNGLAHLSRGGLGGLQGGI
jgi:hypothetical protein